MELQPAALVQSSVRLYDIQLVDDTLARDELFTREAASVLATGDKKRWRSLREQLPAAEMDQVSKFSRRLMELLSGDNWIFFADNVRFADEPQGDELARPEAYVTMEGHDSLLEMGGRVAVFEVERQQLQYYERLFGRFDAVHAIASERDLPAALACLSMSSPVPTTETSRFSRRRAVEAVKRVLELGDPFVEEILNGTHLRIVTRTKSRDEILRAVVEAKTA